MKEKFNTILFATIAIFLTYALIQFPVQTLNASVRGLNVWWEVVFPSLLPFFVTAELLIGFGVVTFIGVLFEPLMRPLFNVPGVGSFAWIMGMASGYPSGAKISTRLREEKQLSQIEAERLVSFTNNASPLFIFGAIAVGFFHDAALGLLIAVSHYLANALVGICMRFYGPSSRSKHNGQHEKVTIRRAFREMHQTRLKNHRPLGQLMGDAVLNSVKTLVMIGGFIVLFSVLTSIIQLIGLTTYLASFIGMILELLSMPAELGLPFLSGIFEITIGANLISDVAINDTLAKVMIVSFILGFNGLSVQAQVASIIANTDIRFKPYFYARLLHGLFGSMLSFFLFVPLYLKRKISQPSNLPVSQADSPNFLTLSLEHLQQVGPIVTLIAIGITIIILYERYRREPS